MPFPLKYVTIQPVTLVSAAFWQNRRPVSIQNFLLLRKLLSIFLSFFMAFVSAGVTQKVSHSRKPQAANTSMGTVFPAFMAAAMKNGHKSAPRA